MKKLLFLVLFLPSMAWAQANSTTLLNGVWTAAQVAFGSITNAYAVALTDTHQKRLCVFTNSTDKTISWDDGTHAIIPEELSNTTVILNFAADGRNVPTSIRVKYTSGAPTSGNADVSCLW